MNANCGSTIFQVADPDGNLLCFGVSVDCGDNA
jgi:hypothetical protein